VGAGGVMLIGFFDSAAAAAITGPNFTLDVYCMVASANKDGATPAKSSKTQTCRNRMMFPSFRYPTPSSNRPDSRDSKKRYSL
jgi:hypothetical protein